MNLNRTQRNLRYTIRFERLALQEVTLREGAKYLVRLRVNMNLTTPIRRVLDNTRLLVTEQLFTRSL